MTERIFYMEAIIALLFLIVVVVVQLFLKQEFIAYEEFSIPELTK